MSAKFEFVSKYEDCGLALPTRGTADSAGYDLTVVKDTIVPTWTSNLVSMVAAHDSITPIELDDLAKLTKKLGTKPTLVSTGLKCKLDNGTYLELSVRSSTPLKYWLVLANSVGIIDADYYNNPDNEGEIFLQLINLSPYPIQLHKGDIIGQGIIKPYLRTEDDNIRSVERVGGFGSTGAK